MRDSHEAPNTYFTSRQAHGHSLVKPRQRPSRIPAGEVKTYSQEVIAHANYVLETQGEKAMNDFLREPKQSGSIETMIQDAKEKIAHFMREAERNNLEARRWKSILEKFEEAVKMLDHKMNPTVSGNGERLSWKPLLKEILTATPGLREPQLREELKKRVPEKSDLAIYQAVNRSLISGCIVKKSEDATIYWQEEARVD